MKNKFYFSISIHFKENVDVFEIQEILKIKASKLTPLEQAKGPNKTARLYFKSKEFEENYSDEIFEKFVEKFKDNFNILPKLLKEYDGRCSFCIVFTELNDSPCINLKNSTLNSLAQIGADFDVDFIN